MSSATNPWAPDELNFERPRRNTTPIRFAISGTGFDDTGFSYKMEATAYYNPAGEATPPTPIFELTASGDGSNVAVFSPSADNMDPAIDVVFYDVEMTDGASKTRTIVKGQITFTPVQTDFEE